MHELRPGPGLWKYALARLTRALACHQFRDAFVSMLRYIELKTGFRDNGPAWIGRVTLSNSGATVYFNGRALTRAKGRGISGNHFDVESGDEFWISRPKKNGEDRRRGCSARILIEAAVVDEYVALRNLTALDSALYEVTNSIVQTDTARFHAIENRRHTIASHDL